MKATAIVFAPLVLIGLSGCVTDTVRSERRVAYACDRGPGLTVIYSGSKAMIVGSGGEKSVLHQRRTASGFWYVSPTHSIRGKGDVITYAVGRMVPMTCTALGPMPR